MPEILVFMKEMETNVKTLRNYQITLANEGVSILKKLSIVYLCMEVRLGKTATAMEIARLFEAKKVLFLTKKKAIPSIEEDYKDFGFNFEIIITNNESLHKVEDDDFDLIVSDEHHRFGSYPKIGKMAFDFKKRFSHLPQIWLSGTPFPEGYSQIFHQFYVSKYTPFEATNFYSYFKKNHFLKSQIKKGGFKANDWSMNTEKICAQITDLGFPKKVEDYIAEYLTKYNTEKIEWIKEKINPYFIRYTQEEAGFKTSVKETTLYCKMRGITYQIANRLIRDRVIKSKTEDILGDTAVKLQQKLHQIYSGTVKFESGNSFTFDDSKAQFIKEKFKGKRIGVFYKFKQELECLKSVFPRLTQDVDSFNNYESDTIALQFVSGREGISLRTADCLVAFNIDFSATTYFQFKDRLTTMDRLENELYWIFAKDGIENKVYGMVEKKKSYTVNAFKKDFKVK